MKYRKVILKAAAIALFLFQSCKKADNGGQYSLTATIGSTRFSTSDATLQTISNTYIVINSTSSSQGSIGLELDTYNGIGTYPLVYRGVLPTAYVEINKSVPTGTIEHDCAYGQIVITSITPNMSGTFYFVCTDSTVVSNGTFSVKGF